MKKIKRFTLIELIVVLIITAVISAYVALRWPGANINVNAETQQLAAEIRYAQSLGRLSIIFYA